MSPRECIEPVSTSFFPDPNVSRFKFSAVHKLCLLVHSVVRACLSIFLSVSSYAMFRTHSRCFRQRSPPLFHTEIESRAVLSPLQESWYSGSETHAHFLQSSVKVSVTHFNKSSHLRPRCRHLLDIQCCMRRSSGAARDWWPTHFLKVTT